MLNLIPGEVIVNPSGWTLVRIAVDDLMSNNVPNVNFWGFLVYHNLIEENENGKYFPKINYLELGESDDEEKNARALKEMEKFKEYFSMSLDIFL